MRDNQVLRHDWYDALTETQWTYDAQFNFVLCSHEACQKELKENGSNWYQVIYLRDSFQQNESLVNESCLINS